jgi:hypothetical protein
MCLGLSFWTTSILQLDTVVAMHESWHGGLSPHGSLSGQQPFEEHLFFLPGTKKGFVPDKVRTSTIIISLTPDNKVVE